MKQKLPHFLLCGVVLICCLILSVFAFVQPDRSALRPFPYPYRSMLTLQSHIDGTTPEEFIQIHLYLNTTNDTMFGPGLGLDVGDSLWLYNVNDGNSYRANDPAPVESYMSWFNGMDPTSINDAQDIIKFWNLGWIDSIHSFGDFSRDDGQALCTRPLAEAAWDAMRKAGIAPTVWINHGTETNKQSFGGYTPITSTKYQSGDDPDSPFYHTDLSIAGGVKFVWNSRNFSSLTTDNPLYLTRLRDGQLVWCFNAYTGYPVEGGYNYMWSPTQFTDILTEENLDSISQAGQYTILANHFGSGDLYEMLTDTNRVAFERLKQYQDAGKIMVVRSSRLLEYAAVRECLRYRAKGNTIDILSVDDPVVGSYMPTPEQLCGITFYVSDSATAQVRISGVPVEEHYLVRNSADETGKESIGFVWYE